MSVDQLLEMQEIHRAGVPVAFVLAANSVWARCEDVSLVALFDTQELAMEYEKAARMPDSVGEVRTRFVDTDTQIGVERVVTMHRNYRPDSLLWDYNLPLDRDGISVVGIPDVPMFSGAPIGVDYAGCPENPTPPAGPILWPDGIKLDEESKIKTEGW